MTFEKFFRSVSYAAVLCGFLSLWVSGTFGAAGTLIFLAVMAVAWLLEGTRWQISEKSGTVLIVFALPLFYFLWKLKYFGTSNTETLLPAILARMVLFLSAIKLLQKKSERDWIFLYLMSFFEVLLAAGLSISALYLGSFVLYLLTIVCAVIAFEMRKTAKATAARQEPSHRFFLDKNSSDSVRVRRLPAAAAILIFFAVVAGIPLFFLLPRVGGAGFGSDQERIKNTSGFGESIRLGGVGAIQQSDAVVMRVRLDDNSALRGDTHWRGIALDTFDNQNWTRSQKATQQVVRGDGDLFLVDAASG
ncbi:MAG: DUF3488 domain-containing protein, partial [Acidobacteriota bacterium]